MAARIAVGNPGRASYLPPVKDAGRSGGQGPSARRAPARFRGQLTVMSELPLLW